MLHTKRYRLTVAVAILFASAQTVCADYRTVGKLAKDVSDGHTAEVFVVGNDKINLSHNGVRTYKAARRGDAAAQYEFAKLLNTAPHSRDAMPRVAEEAFAWAMRSAMQGNADAENYVGVAYKEGDGVRKDRQAAVQWLTKAIDHGSAKAMCNLAILRVEDGNIKEAVRFARKSALCGYSGGQVQWGRMNLLGQGVPVDEKKAVVWFTKAAKQDDTNAIALLAMCYQTGKGTDKNPQRAIKLYENVADKKNTVLLSTIARAALAEIYFEEEAVLDNALAVKWAMDALRDGGAEILVKYEYDTIAASMQYIIGFSYYKGKGVVKDSDGAKKWLKLAVAGGNICAKALLAEMAEAERIQKEHEIAVAKAREEAERRRQEEQELVERKKEEKGEENKYKIESEDFGRAKDAIAGALENVRSRYRAKLYHYGLTESYFDETIGICDLMLLDVERWIKYQIVYYRSTDQIEWPRMMPKSVAKDLMADRLVIHAYELSLGKTGRK